MTPRTSFPTCAENFKETFDYNSADFRQLCSEIEAETKTAGEALRIQTADNDTEPEFKPGMQKQGLELLKCVEEGEVKTRTAAAQRFQGWLDNNEDEKLKYSNMTGKAGSKTMKANFRLTWAKMELQDKIVVRRSKKEILEEQLGEKGEYMAFDRIVIAEGGETSPAAVKRAVNYCKHAMAAGEPFLEYHEWKEATEILYFRKIRTSVFTTKWSLERVEEKEFKPMMKLAGGASGPGAEMSAGGASEPGAEKSTRAKKSAGGASGPGAEKSAGASEPGAEKPAPASQTKVPGAPLQGSGSLPAAGIAKASNSPRAIVEPMKAANFLKSRVKKAEQSFRELMWNLENNPSYELVNTDKARQELKELKEELDEQITKTSSMPCS